MPNLIEEYVQESGWSGQGGLLSEAVLIKNSEIYWEGIIMRAEYSNLQKKIFFQNFLCYKEVWGGLSWLYFKRGRLPPESVYNQSPASWSFN